jgi:hypothetical protein
MNKIDEEQLYRIAGAEAMWKPGWRISSWETRDTRYGKH